MFSVTAAVTVRPLVAADARASTRRVARAASPRAVCSSFAAPRRGAATLARAEEKEASSKTVDVLDEMPPWERREMEKKAAIEKCGLPWPAYLGLAAIVTIASV